MSDNRIEIIPQGLVQQFSELITLKLARNWLVEIPSRVIQAMSELRTLDVSFNRIKQFPYGPGELSNLHKLDVRGNPLTSIPSFLKNTKISILVSEWAYIARTNEIELARVSRLFVAGQDTSAILSRASGLVASDSTSSCFSIRSQQLHSLFQM